MLSLENHHLFALQADLYNVLITKTEHYRHYQYQAQPTVTGYYYFNVQSFPFVCAGRGWGLTFLSLHYILSLS